MTVLQQAKGGSRLHEERGHTERQVKCMNGLEEMSRHWTKKLFVGKMEAGEGHARGKLHYIQAA